MARGGSKKGERRGGREKGTPNKATAEMREAYATLLSHNVPRLQGLFDQLAAKDPGRALELHAKFAEFTTPKLARTEIAGEGGGALKIEIVQYANSPSAA